MITNEHISSQIEKNKTKQTERRKVLQKGASALLLIVLMGFLIFLLKGETLDLAPTKLIHKEEPSTVTKRGDTGHYELHIGSHIFNESRATPVISV